MTSENDSITPPASPTSSEISYLVDNYQNTEVETEEWRHWNAIQSIGACPNKQFPAGTSMSAPRDTYSVLFITVIDAEGGLFVGSQDLRADETIGELLQRMDLNISDVILHLADISLPPHCSSCNSSHWIVDATRTPQEVHRDETGKTLGLQLGSDTFLHLIHKCKEVQLIMEYNHKSDDRQYSRVLAMRLHMDSPLLLAAAEAKKHFGIDLKLFTASSQGQLLEVDLEKSAGELGWDTEDCYNIINLQLSQ